MRTAALVIIGAALGFAAGAASGGAWTRRLQARLAAAEAVALEAQERAGAACEPVFAAVYQERDCPLALRWMPATLQVLACPGRQQVYRHPDMARVLERLRDLPAGAEVFEERGAKERRVEVIWKPEVRR